MKKQQKGLAVQMDVKWVLSTNCLMQKFAKICKIKICYTTSLVLVKNMTAQLILGTPFLTLLYHFKMIERKKVSEVLEKEICFDFIRPPRLKELNMLHEASITKVTWIQRKQKHINMLNKEIKYKRIEE